MRFEDFVDEAEIRKAVEVLKEPNQLFEVRIINGKKTFSGYFISAETLIEQLKTVNLRDTNVYFTLNYINNDCYYKLQHDKFLLNPSTTSDSDVLGYQWMLIDFDPVRHPADISSSDEELQEARSLATKVYEYLKNLGFEEPLKAKSGNGYHLLYKLKLSKTDENIELVHRCLDVISELFSNEKVKIDTVNYNPSRICKLYGTLAQKGSNSDVRPFRMSKIFQPEKELTTTDIGFLHKLCDQLPVEEKAEPARANNGNKFDLDEFIKENHIEYKEYQNTGRDCSKIYALDECPFDHNHKDGDAKLFLYPNGAIAFKCHHNSCSKYRWQDFRQKYDPDAYSYEKREIDTKYDEGWKQHNRNKEENPLDVDPNQELFRTAKEIFLDDEPDHEFIKCGITEVDKTMHGLEKQCISVISGLRGSGKSTLLGTIALQAIEDNHTVFVYSGELSNKKYLNWLLRQAAGKNNVEVSTRFRNGVGVPADTSEKIVNWMGNNFWLYDNSFGNDYSKISYSLRAELIKKKADLCIIDNLMALDLDKYDKDKYESQTRFVLDLKKIAIETNTHIICVAHPRKSTSFLRLDDISGSGNIANAVDNAFMVHRVNKDFEKRFKETIDSKGPSAYGIDKEATNVIEIAKDRENGTMDYFIPLYYEARSKRLMNDKYENVVYGWENTVNTPVFYSMSDIDDEDLPF